MEYEAQTNKLSEEDKVKFRKYVEGYKQKLRKYWGGLNATYKYRGTVS